MVEAVGIEPTSEDPQLEAATPIVRDLNLARPGSHGRDPGQASLIGLASRYPGPSATPASEILTSDPTPRWRGAGERHRLRGEC